MASLSLPRVLQLKKNSLDAEREQFEKFQTLAIQKAINAIETPVKEKHVRSTIIGTFQEQSAVTYWMVAVRLPLQDNRIVSWKFCHVTHKLLREGHPACLDDSQRHIGMIENLGKLWVHLREGYGRLIHLYSNLLVTKLKFHARNPRFPGNMQVSADELDSIAENDVNNYFQLCVELFDYMDDILTLQAAVFESLGNARANSMTASGQCRLAALIPCAQDASHAYDCGVRLLFRLHAALPADTLAGHRERFRQQFKKLSSFYKHASSLQYYRNLLTLPVLPSNPPNFLLQSEFGAYVTPVVSVPEPPPDEPDAIAALIDTSDTMSQAASSEQLEEPRASPSPAPDPIVERDRLIEHLQGELRRMRSEVSQIIQERNTMLGSMREHCSRVESQLQTTKNELEEEKQKAEILLVQAPEIKKKLTETEEKAKVSDEKFQKLKGAYTQLREEHIALIRQKAEVDKAASSLRAAAAQHESAKTMLQQQLNDRMKDMELLQQSASSSEEIEAYKTEISNLRTDLEHSRQKEVELESLRASMEALEIEHKTATTEQQEKILMISAELKDATESLEKCKQEIKEKDGELNKVKEELTGLRQKSGDEYKKAIEEKEAALKQVSELTQQYQQEKEEHINRSKTLQAELENLQKKIVDMEHSLTRKCEKLEEEIQTNNIHYKNTLLQKDNEIKDALEKVAALQNEIDTVQKESQQTIMEQTETIKQLQDMINELNQSKDASNITKSNMELQIENLQQKLKENINEQITLQNTVTEKTNKIIDLINRVTKLEESIKEKDLILEEVKNATSEEITSHLTTIDELQQQLKKKDTEASEILLKLTAADALATEQKVQYEAYKSESQEVISSLKLTLESTISTKDKHIQGLETDLIDKDEKISELQTVVTELKASATELSQEMTNLQDKLNEISISKQSLENTLSEKDSELQLMEARLSHTEGERLNAECELQDLLQQNTILEADMAALKIQLEEANAEIKKKTSRLVGCAGEVALKVTDEAMSAFENSNSQENNQLACELAAKALEDLARKSQIEGNEELVAKSAILAAHSAAQLSVHVGEVANITTDAELADKLNNECRNMLNSVKRCLEGVSSGTLDRSACMDARGAVQGAGRAAAGGALRPGQDSVDDELALMDRAIEQAAKQIEEMLAASRKDDSGVKLEVNEKILDACTTLMAAVKILVQDARKLQNEIGDPKTRQKMYRKNPQWSEGLISAAKAVVFAAKLLVTSADEAAGASGRVEGVSAAAHEVAGSTAQLVAASRARAPPAAPALARLTAASRGVAAAAGAVVAAVRAASALVNDTEALDTSSLSLTATRRLEMESKVRALELESALDAERARLAALRRRHYQLAQLHENGNVTNGDE